MGYYNDSECSCRRVCGGILAAILIIAATLIFTVGLIIGAILFGLVLSNLAVFIAFAAVMTILLIILLIVRAYRGCRCN